MFLSKKPSKMLQKITARHFVYVFRICVHKCCEKNLPNYKIIKRKYFFCHYCFLRMVVVVLFLTSKIFEKPYRMIFFLRNKKIKSERPTFQITCVTLELSKNLFMQLEQAHFIIVFVESIFAALFGRFGNFDIR